ncbi:hypothetical protein B566_EDAN004035 [Ephemera danica]|nr:hypothetical protein B566_EDAN004035 [Ephemera danica]
MLSHLLTGFYFWILKRRNMSIAPFIRSPFTDMTGPMVNHQIKGPCAKIELRAMECLEAYGIDRGVKHPRCTPLIEDYRECETQMKQRMRVQAMRLERHRQYVMGESKEHYAPGPRPDAL